MKTTALPAVGVLLAEGLWLVWPWLAPPWLRASAAAEGGSDLLVVLDGTASRLAAGESIAAALPQPP